MTPIDVVREFQEAAAEYCALVESHASYAPAEFLAGCRDLLPRLYHLAGSLPDFPSGPHLEETDPVSRAEWAALFRGLGKHLGVHGAYFQAYDPYVLEDATAASLADDLADIYRDLQGGLRMAAAEGRPGKIAAVWYWRFRFRCHWGGHVVDALRPLHRLFETTPDGGV